MRDIEAEQILDKHVSTDNSATADTQSSKTKEGRDASGRFMKKNRLGFQSGQSANPAGRPRILILPVEYLSQIDPKNPQCHGYEKQIVNARRRLAAFKKKRTNAPKSVAAPIKDTERQIQQVQRSEQGRHARLIKRVMRQVRKAGGGKMTRDEAEEFIAVWKADLFKFYPQLRE